MRLLQWVGVFALVVFSTELALADDGLAIDFSYAGYAGGGIVVPSPKSVLRVRPTGADDTAMLQAAIDQIMAAPVGADGFRGAILFSPGEFRVAGQLRISQSGIVLRGSGEGTIIKATGTSRRTLIDVRPTTQPIFGDPVYVVDQIAPAGAMTLSLEGVDPFKPGDRVVITRPCTQEWVASLAADGGPGSRWAPGSRELKWDRTVVAIDAAKKQITLDAPTTTALAKAFGGGTVSRLQGNGPITQIGIESMTVVSSFDEKNPKDEDHSWFAIALDGVEDAWMRNVTTRHFASSAVHVLPHARRISIANCRSEKPISEPGGFRRLSFYIEGQQVLVQGCFAEAGVNDFALGLCAAGPNVFLDCQTKGSLGASGGYESWASGALYERVKIDGAPLMLGYERRRTPGAGWTAANSIAWNCKATEIDVNGPKSAPNLAKDSPEPLYQTLLKARGKSLPQISADATVNVDAPDFKFDPAKASAPKPQSHPISIVNGYFVLDNKVLTGGMVHEGWWRGQSIPAGALANGGVNIARWVPGREGPGLTEDLSALAAKMVAQRTPFYQSIPGLWYDRRRDSHGTAPQPDANVWPPFLELPWARSGQGTAYDGLSKYDLTRFNGWYYERFREFSSLCDQNGLLLFHHLYDMHNTLENPAHNAEYPWRVANNINDTGLPEPAAVNGSNLVMGNVLYDATSPKLRELHRKFILHELDEIGDQPNVIFSVCFQFVGPLAFQQFFQDTVAEWETAHNKRVKIALMTTKDITDAIMSDPVRSKQIAVIDMHFWQYRPDGSLFAPNGGQNLAFRQMVGKANNNRQGDHPPPTSPEQAYRQVREYRDRYPQVALLAWNNGVGAVPSFMAGAAKVMMNSPNTGHNQISGEADRTRLDDFLEQHLSSVLMNMRPTDNLAKSNQGPAWCLADEKLSNVLIASPNGASITLGDLPADKKYEGIWVDPGSGRSIAADAQAQWKGTTLTKPSGASMLYLKWK